jgi:alginate O-acetyltransferase complex protein AlgI
MIFNTYWFVCFAAIFYPVYWLLFRPALRLAWLLAGCAVFHAHFAGAAGVLPIIVLGLVTYVVALSRRRFLCAAGIVLCLAGLGFYKYAAFLCHDVLAAFAPALADRLEPRNGGFAAIAAPLAISFFTFEFVHYLVDVRRGHEPIRRPADFALFALHFPSLVAGPIKRYESYIPDLHAGLARVSVDDVATGAQRVALGLVKKVVLADNLALALDYYGKRYADLSPGQAWLYLAALSARLLLDFSGYSDLAIGFSRMLGVRLPENFNFPYLAANLQDFWRRWHISLSTWIRDYVYIPLGGSRHGPFRKLVNGLIAFALVGLWHGPAWHFALWGLWHGAGLAVSSTYVTLLGPTGVELERGMARWPVLAWGLTMLHVSLGWLLFFYQPQQAWSMAIKLLEVFR